MVTFIEESSNGLIGNLGDAAKRILELSGVLYGTGQLDDAIRHACASNSSFVGELYTSAKSVGEAHVASRDYARKQAQLRNTSMLRMTRADYWAGALKAATKDELFYSLLTDADIATHRSYTTSTEGVSVAGSFALDDAGNVIETSVVLLGEGLA